MKIAAYMTTLIDGDVRITECTADKITRITTHKLDEIFSFLCEDFSEPTLKIFWELNNGLAPIFRMFKRETIAKLHHDKKLFIKPYSLFYLPNKIFTVKHASSPTRHKYYGIEQYYPDTDKPNTADVLEIYGRELYDTLKRMGLRPTKLTSAIGIYEECVFNHLNLPTVFDA